MENCEISSVEKSSKEELKKAVENGAIIVDVRVREKYDLGHPKGAINIPLSEMEGRIESFKKEKKTIIVCCTSGGKSGRATELLRKNSVDVLNAGGWTNLEFLEK